MKTTGQYLHNISSLFLASGSRRKRQTNRQEKWSVSESLEQRQLLTVPALSSDPNGQMAVFLDFGGESYFNQSVYVTPTRFLDRMTPIPAFSLDSTPGPDSPVEERMIEEIYFRVAEDFRPFNVNVTTVAPAAGVPQIHVSIGGTGAVQYQTVTTIVDPTTGAITTVVSAPLNYLFTSPVYADLGAYSNRPANPVFVFPLQLSTVDQNGLQIARLVSRGVGTQLGLQNLRSTGTAASGPIMGAPNQNPVRDTWTVTAAQPAQDDINVMVGGGAFVNPGFRLRADDVGNNVLNAAPALDVLVSRSTVNTVDLAKGIINASASRANVDRDFFAAVLNLSGTTGTAELTIDVKGLNLGTHAFLDKSVDAKLNPGSNLNAVVRLYNGNGTLLGGANPALSNDAQIVYEIPASSIPSNRILTYFVEITTTPEVGSLGEYTLTGSLQEVLGAPVVLAPTGTISTVIPSFGWTASLKATGYVLEVSNATTGAVIFTKTTTGITYTVNPEDINVQPRPINSLPEGTYRTRVKAIRGTGGLNNESVFSPYFDFRIDVPLPSKPIIIRPKAETGDSFPVFEWSKGANDRSYSLLVTIKGTSTRVINRTAFVGNSYTHFSPLVDGAYSFTVRAFNAVNEAGAISEIVDFTVKSPLPVAPKLSAPAVVTTSTQPRFIWNAVLGAARYELKVDNLSTGVGNYIREANLTRTKTFFDPPYMTQGNYAAYIRAINGNGVVSPWSAKYSFTVNILPPDAPVLSGPRGANDSSTITITNPTFTWTKPARAEKYELLVNNLTTQTAGVIRKTGLTANTFTSLENMPQGNYRAWVRGFNAAGEVGDWSAPLDFSIDEPTPVVPTMTGPVLNTLGYVENANPTFTWKSTPSAPFYDFTLYNVTLQKTEILVFKLTTAEYRIPELKRLGEFTYRAQVRAVNISGDRSDWSASYQIRVNVPDPTTPIAIGPGDTTTDRTPLFSWTHTASSFKYELLIRDLVRGESITLQVTSFQLSPGGATASYTLPDSKALELGTYRFWVRAFNSQGQASSWSTSKTFVISVQLDPSLIEQDQQPVGNDLLIAAFDSPKKPAPTKVVTESDSESEPETTVPHAFYDAAVVETSLVTSSADSSDEATLIDAVMRRMADPSAEMDLLDSLS